MVLTSLGKYREAGLLIIRLGIGLSFLILHGYPKLMGGTPMWEGIGGSMGNLGINFAPTAFGFMAALTEGLGGLLFAIGLFFRPACIFLFLVMVVAATYHLSLPAGSQGAGWGQASHAIEVGAVFLGMMFVGPGKYSIDKK